MENYTKLEIIHGKQKKDPTKEWKALKVTIGDWSTVFFPKSKFEMDYIEKTLEENDN